MMVHMLQRTEPQNQKTSTGESRPTWTSYMIEEATASLVVNNRWMSALRSCHVLDLDVEPSGHSSSLLLKVSATAFEKSWWNSSSGVVSLHSDRQKKAESRYG